MSGAFPVSKQEWSARHKAFAGGRTVVALLAWVPLLALYLLTHTKYLRPYVPESKASAVFMLIVVPFAWFIGSTLVYRWLGPARHGLKCPGCGDRLVDAKHKAALESGRCPSCQAEVVSGAGAA